MQTNRLNIFCCFFSQINLGVNDFQMLMTVLNDNLLEGQHGKYRLHARCSVICRK